MLVNKRSDCTHAFLRKKGSLPFVHMSCPNKRDTYQRWKEYKVKRHFLQRKRGNCYSQMVNYQRLFRGTLPQLKKGLLGAYFKHWGHGAPAPSPLFLQGAPPLVSLSPRQRTLGHCFCLKTVSLIINVPYLCCLYCSIVPFPYIWASSSLDRFRFSSFTRLFRSKTWRYRGYIMIWYNNGILLLLLPGVEPSLAEHAIFLMFLIQLICYIVKQFTPRKLPMQKILTLYLLLFTLCYKIHMFEALQIHWLILKRPHQQL